MKRKKKKEKIKIYLLLLVQKSRDLRANRLRLPSEKMRLCDNTWKGKHVSVCVLFFDHAKDQRP